MKKVTREEFYNRIGKSNCHPTSEGKYPYTTVFKTPNRHVVGEIRPIPEYTEKGNLVYPIKEEYFVDK